MRRASELTVDVVSPSQFLERALKCEGSRKIEKVFIQMLFLSDLEEKPHVLMSLTQKAALMLIDRDILWHERRELREMLLLGLSDHLHSSVSGQRIFEWVVKAHGVLTNPPQNELAVMRSFYENSQLRFNRLVARDLKDNTAYPYQEYRLSSDSYSHLGHFSWIYAREIELLRIRLSESHADEIALLDEGSGFGHFIMTCAAVLQPQELARIHFYGIDRKEQDTIFAVEESRRFPNLNVTWLIGDITAEDHQGRLATLHNGHPVDMIVANHILEHLEFPPADKVWQWVQMSKSALAISVPLEDSLKSTLSDHANEFTVETLRSLGREIERRSHGAMVADSRYVEGGVLLFQRKLIFDVAPPVVPPEKVPASSRLGIHGAGFQKVFRQELRAAFEEFSQSVLIPGVSKPLPEPLRPDRRIVAIGDVHGELRALLCILISAGLIHPMTGDWIGGPARLILIGDIINRGFRHPLGEFPLEACLYLRNLYAEAHQFGGNVTALVGNTEMRMLTGNRRSLEPYLTFPGIFEWLKSELQAQVREGYLQVLAHGGGLLFAHAFVSRQHVLKEEGLAAFVERANGELQRALANDNFKHPLFHEENGVMWMATREGTSDSLAFDLVYGHNEREHGEPELLFDRRAVNIDVGFTRKNRGYVTLTDNRLQAYSLRKNRQAA